MTRTKKCIIRLVSAVIAACAVLLSGAAGAQRQPLLASRAFAYSDATTAALNDRKNELEKKQKQLQGELTQLRTQKDQALAQKSNLDELISITNEKIATSEELLKSLNEQIAAAETEIGELTEKIDATFKSFQNRMRQSYEEGDASYLGILLGSDSLSDFLSRSERILSFLDYDKGLMTQYEKDKTELEQAKAALDESLANQKETMKSLEADKAEYESLYAESEALFETIKSDEATVQAAYKKAKAEEDALDAQLSEYLRNRQSQTNNPYVGGEMMWPLPVRGIMTCNFGWRDMNNDGVLDDYHQAIDIAVPLGTSIFAANGGEVVKAGWSGSYGNYIMIDHGGGKATLYAHCSALLVSSGQTVAKGATIGRVGSTGNSYGYHLHFEVRINGTRTDPLPYLKG